MTDDLLSTMTTTFEVHPVAALFPMMTDQELQELAADIKTNGLTHAIVLDDNDLLIDGRNRLKACSIAGIEPRFERLNGVDPVAFILSNNIARRHMMAGQRAMIVAKIYPEPTQRGGSADTRKQSFAAKDYPMVPSGTLTKARTILAHAPDLVDGIIAGSSLDDAYKKACERRQLASSNEAKMANLRDRAIDLSDLVIEGRMSIDEALAAMNERDRKTRMLIEQGREAAQQGMTDFLANVGAIISAAQLGATDLIEPERLNEVIDAAMKLKTFLAGETT